MAITIFMYNGDSMTNHCREYKNKSFFIESWKFLQKTYIVVNKVGVSLDFLPRNDWGDDSMLSCILAVSAFFMIHMVVSFWLVWGELKWWNKDEGK